MTHEHYEHWYLSKRSVFLGVLSFFLSVCLAFTCHCLVQLSLFIDRQGEEENPHPPRGLGTLGTLGTLCCEEVWLQPVAIASGSCRKVVLANPLCGYWRQVWLAAEKHRKSNFFAAAVWESPATCKTHPFMYWSEIDPIKIRPVLSMTCTITTITTFSYFTLGVVTLDL